MADSLPQPGDAQFDHDFPDPLPALRGDQGDEFRTGLHFVSPSPRLEAVVILSKPDWRPKLQTSFDLQALEILSIPDGRPKLETPFDTVWLQGARTEFKAASAYTSALENVNNGTRGILFRHLLGATYDFDRPSWFSLGSTLGKLTTSMKEVLDFFECNRAARDDLTWFKTLIGIDGSIIITLIFKSTSNNRNSLPVEIIESYTACCAVVGFSSSLAGLYLNTYKPKSLPFGCDPEVSAQKMGIVGGLATAFGFTTGVLLLLPNNLFRGITMAVASVASTIPIFFKFRPSSEARPNVPFLETDTDVPFSVADIDLGDMV